MDVPRRTLLCLIAAYITAGVTRIHCQDQPSTNQKPASDSPSAKGAPYPRPYQAIENAASATQKVGDAKTVRELVERLFADPSIYRMPEVMAAVVKQRLIDAQIAYLDRKASGVIEGAVVDAMNALATTFDAPDYAMVSTLQLRFLRNRMASGMPVFMGSVPEAKADEPNSPMSPLQAMFLMSVLINQQRLNPDDQVPPVEWDRDFYPRLLEQASSR